MVSSLVTEMSKIKKKEEHGHLVSKRSNNGFAKKIIEAGKSRNKQRGKQGGNILNK